MTAIKTMTPRRWVKFGKIVPTGSEVRAIREGVVLWHGVMLENYPYDKEEFIERECEAPRYLKQNMKQLHAQPVLRMQEFNALRETTFLVRTSRGKASVQYLVAGEWVTLSQILK
jgi:hypothetical protein